MQVLKTALQALGAFIFAFLFSVGMLIGLTGCGGLAYKDMTAEQIKATAGTTSCTQYEGLYGNAATIALNADDTRKGATSRGKMQITCGKATMVIENEVSAPVPAVVPK